MNIIKSILFTAIVTLSTIAYGMTDETKYDDYVCRNVAVLQSMTRDLHSPKVMLDILLGKCEDKALGITKGVSSRIATPAEQKIMEQAFIYCVLVNRRYVEEQLRNENFKYALITIQPQYHIRVALHNYTIEPTPIPKFIEDSTYLSYKLDYWTGKQDEDPSAAETFTDKGNLLDVLSMVKEQRDLTTDSSNPNTFERFQALKSKYFEVQGPHYRCYNLKALLIADFLFNSPAFYSLVPKATNDLTTQQTFSVVLSFLEGFSDTRLNEIFLKIPRVLDLVPILTASCL